MRIIIVDDDRAHGESLSDLLNSRGHEACFASSGEEAEWLLGLVRFDLAIVDCDMPRLSGPQVARRLLEREPGLRTALMSARELSEEHRLEAGSLPFIPKPIRAEALLDLIHGAGSPPASAAVAVRAAFPLLPAPRRSPD
ncbi:MAG: response regulator [Planctomycetes bacterium]|nr:response regulator [Planctomycetota bacterium]